MKPHHIFAVIATLLLLVGCNSTRPTNRVGPGVDAVQSNAAPGYTDKTYTRDDTTILSNPERGLIWDGANRGRRGYTVWDPKTLIKIQSGQTLLRFDIGLKPCRDLDDLKEVIPDPNDPTKTIPKVGECYYLAENLSNWFANIRAKGLKLVILPYYMYSSDTSKDASGNYLEYDPPLTRVLGHILQLTEVLHANEDVIAYVQMGFIGYWGEMWSYDPAECSWDTVPEGIQCQTTLLKPSNYLSILQATENMLPNRFALVREPRFLSMVSVTSVSSADAFGSSTIARTGFYNSCIMGGLTSGSNVGTDCNTYPDSTLVNPNSPERQYIKAQGLYTPVGGETWEQGFSRPGLTYSSIVQEFQDQHWTYLRNFSSTALNQLSSFKLDRKTTLRDTLNRRLGYRLSLKNASLPNALTRGQGANLSFVVENTGFAAPMNPRKVQLVLSGSSTHRIDLPVDPRRWLAGQQNIISTTATIPLSVPAGTYAAYLALPAPEPSLAGDTRYAIRLANSGSGFWNSSLGANNLSHNITVN